MRCLVTGGSGFIGSHLVEQLVKLGHQVTVLDNFCTGKIKNLKNVKKKVRIIEIDISNYNVEKYFKKIDYVFHLAALADIVPSINNPKNYFESNVVGTFNVLEACRKNNIKKVIYLASSTCYGIPDKYPTPENYKINPQYPYALTKYFGELLTLHWAKVYKLKFISLRLFNVYGTRSRTSGSYGAVFGVFLAQKLAKKPFTIVGNGKQKRDFTYVSDVVEAIIKAIKSKKFNKIYNVGCGKSISVNHIANLLKGKRVYIPKRPGEPNMTFADIKKISKDLKWYPKINISEGVNLILKNIDLWKDAPVWTPEKIRVATKNWFKFLS
jgi:UDP-glucose 4-epimerase